MSTEPRDATQVLVDDGRRLADDTRQLVDHLREDNPLAHAYNQNPFLVLAAAAGVGYVLGGGLLTPFTRRLLRVGLKAAALPVAASQIKGLVRTASGDDLSETP